MAKPARQSSLKGTYSIAFRGNVIEKVDKYYRAFANGDGENFTSRSQYVEDCVRKDLRRRGV